MNKVIVIFIAVFGIAFLILSQYEHIVPTTVESISNKEAPQNTLPKENDVKIVYTQQAKEIPKREEPMQLNNGMHTLSSTKANGYTIALQSYQKPEKNQFSPPQIPTIIRGEINGEKFSLLLEHEAKKETLILSVSQNGVSAFIDGSKLGQTSAGQSVDIGNLTPPTQLTNENSSAFTQSAQSTINSNVTQSQNTQTTTSLAPPTPPTIGK